MMKRIMIVMAVSFAGVLWLGHSSCQADIPLNGDAKVHFASKEEAVPIITKRDKYLNSMSRFDLQSHMNSKGSPTVDELIEFISSNVLTFTDEETSRLGKLFESIQKRLSPYQIPLPPVVMVAKTTGKEEAGAAYCRSNVIVLPQAYVNYPEQRLEPILIHELFHIVSNHAPETVQQKLYPLVGFTAVSPIDLPADLKNRKITNPDAPLVNCVMRLTVDKKEVTAAPVIFSSEANFDPDAGRSFFQYLTFRLIVVKQDGKRWIADEAAGQPQLLEPENQPDFQRQIGGNTRYVWHPEEILADNFMHLAMNRANLPTPRIIDGMKQVFARP